MGVFIAKRYYQTETRGNVDLNFLYACIGEKIKVVTQIYYTEICVAGPDNRIIWVPTADLSNMAYNDDLLYTEGSVFFNNLQPGDTFKTRGVGHLNNGTFTVSEIINGGLARILEPIAQENFETNMEGIYNDTPLKSFIYQFGIGINGFTSQVDNSNQKFIVNSNSQLDSITVVLENVGKKDWQFDVLTSEGIGHGPDVTQQRLIITHDTVVGPMFLIGQYDDLFNGIAPSYFLPDNKIKYRARIDYQKNAYNINSTNTLDVDATGQFGWFNTKFNGGQTPYSLTNLQFKRTDASIANQLEYDPIEVKFRINSANSNFDTINTALVFGFNYLPSDESFYQNTNRDIETNYAFDSKRLLPDNVVVNGNKFGTSLQIIKNIKAEVISTSIVEVTVNIDIAPGQYPILKQGDIAQYNLWCIVEDLSLTPELSDKSNLLVDVNYIYVQKTKIDLLDADNVFIEHPYEIPDKGKYTLEMFPVDDVVANTLFTLDYTGLESDGIVIKSITPQIVLKRVDEADIVLDSFFISTENYPTVGNLPEVQDINFSADRPYKIEDGIRKTITFKRDYLSDSGNTKAWVLSFPFMNRWEYWIKIASLNQIPETLFDPALPFNGANHFWNRLINSSGWTAVYRTTFGLLQNGEDFEQQFDFELTSTDFNSNTDWSDCTIKSYDIPTNSEIISGSKKFVYSNQSQKDTLIEASFTKSNGDVPDLMSVAMVLWCESYEGNGVSEIKRISSVYDVNNLSCWKAVDGSKIVQIEKNINIFTGRAVLDFSKLPNSKKVTIYARIYEIDSDIPEGARITNNNILRSTNDDFIRIVN